MDTNASLTAGKNISYWINSVDPISYNKLDRNETADAVIIGGGIAGVAVFILLI